MEQAAFQALLLRYSKGECTPQEVRQVEAWYETLRKGQQPELRPQELQQLQDTMWRRIEAKAQLTPPQSAPKLVRWQAGAGPALRWAAAALVVFSLCVGLLLMRQAQRQPTWATRTNTSGQQLQLRLPDGTSVALQQGSTLRYPEQFDGPRREIYLTGEATFDVYHNAAQPFMVYTKQVVTTVLGTCFTVRAYASQLGTVVKVRRGKVRVSARTASAPTFHNVEANPTSVILLPNQQASYSDHAHQLRKTLVDQPILLGTNPQLFTNKPVAEVLTALSKAYGIGIVYDPVQLKNCTVNMAFNNETLYQRLDLLCKALNASYERTDAQIVFHSKGCPAS